MLPDSEPAFYNAFISDGIVPDTYGLRTVVEHRFQMISLPPQDSTFAQPSPDVIMAAPTDDLAQSTPHNTTLQHPDFLERENTLRALAKFLDIAALSAVDPRYLPVLRIQPPVLTTPPPSPPESHQHNAPLKLYHKARRFLFDPPSNPRTYPALLSWHWADDMLAAATGTNLDKLCAYNFRKAQWDTSSDNIPPALGAIHCIAFRPFSGRVLAIGCQAGTALLSGQNLSFLSFDNHTNVISIDWSPDGSQLATASADDGSVRLWDIGTRSSIFVDRGCMVKFSPARKPGFLFVASASSPSFRLWSCASWTNERWGSLSGPVTACTWSEDGSTLLFSTENESAIHVISVAVHRGEEGTQLVHTEVTALPREGPGGTPIMLEMDSSGERLAVAYNLPASDEDAQVASLEDGMAIDEHRRYAVAMYATQLSPGFRMSPIGYVSGPEKSGPVVALKFKPKNTGDLGALLACMWRSGDISFTQLIFNPSK